MDRQEKGADLERRVEAYFIQNGYATERNVFREGRSGARHEIDVLASKSDGVVHFSVLVECKAWESSVAKETVSKLSMIMADLGVNKGIIVSLRGWTSGAELSAKQLGVDLWGNEELRDKLGAVAIAEVSASRSTRTGRGIELAIDPGETKRRLTASARGFLGIWREELIWIQLIWVPFFLVTIDTAKSRATLMKGIVTESATKWNLYDAISGHLFKSFDRPPGLTDVSLGLSVPPIAQGRRLQRDINEAIAKKRSVVTPKAQQRHATRIAALGIPTDSDEAIVTSSEIVYWPFYCSLVRSQGKQRISSIDGNGGLRFASIDAALSANVNQVVAVAGSKAEPSPVEAHRWEPLVESLIPAVALIVAIAAFAWMIWGNGGSISGLISAAVGVVVGIAFVWWRSQQ